MYVVLLICAKGNYYSRQVGRWSQQYQQSRTDNIPEMDQLMEWLSTHIPAADRTTIVHGDFRLGMCIDGLLRVVFTVYAVYCIYYLLC